MTLVGAAPVHALIACTNLATLLLGEAWSVKRSSRCVPPSAPVGSDDPADLYHETLSSRCSVAQGEISSRPRRRRSCRVWFPTRCQFPRHQAPTFMLTPLGALVTFVTGLAFHICRRSPAYTRCRPANAVGARGWAQRAGRHTRSCAAGRGGRHRLHRSTGRFRPADTRALARATGDPGFRSANVLTMRTALPSPKSQVERRQQFYDRVLTETRALPGVSNASFISSPCR